MSNGIYLDAFLLKYWKCEFGISFVPFRESTFYLVFRRFNAKYSHIGKRFGIPMLRETDTSAKGCQNDSKMWAVALAHQSFQFAMVSICVARSECSSCDLIRISSQMRTLGQSQKHKYIFRVSNYTPSERRYKKNDESSDAS